MQRLQDILSKPFEYLVRSPRKARKAAPRRHLPQILKQEHHVAADALPEPALPPPRKRVNRHTGHPYAPPPLSINSQTPHRTEAPDVCAATDAQHAAGPAFRGRPYRADVNTPIIKNTFAPPGPSQPARPRRFTRPQAGFGITPPPQGWWPRRADEPTPPTFVRPPAPARHAPLRPLGVPTGGPEPRAERPADGRHFVPRQPAAGPQRVYKEKRRARRLARGHPSIYPQSYIEAQQRENADNLLLENPLVQELLASGPLDAEDREFLRQMESMVVDKAVQENMVHARTAVARAAALLPKRLQKMREEERAELHRPEEERLAEEQRLEEAHLAELRLQEERFRAEEAEREAEVQQMIRRMAELREAEEAARREEQARKEEARRKEEQAREQTRRANRMFAEEAQRLLRERRLKEMRAQRQDAAERTRANQGVADVLAAYELTWAAYKAQGPPKSTHFVKVPWPVLPAVADVEDITCERVREFVFHPLRQGFEGKSRRERLKAEVLRWHPDKFNAIVLPHVWTLEQALVQEAAGVVARLLNQIMAEEA